MSLRRLLPGDWKGAASWIVMMAVVIIVFSLINPRFASLENLRNVLVQASVPLIVVVGATLVILLGSIDLSVQGVMGAAGMAWILLSPNARGGVDLGVWAWVIAIGIGLLLGLLNGVIYGKFKVPSFVVTLGTWNVGLGVGTILYGDDLLPSLTSDALSQWPTRLTLGLPNSFWLSAIVILCGVLLTEFTQLGRGILAIGNNEPLAVVNGKGAGRPLDADLVPNNTPLTVGEPFVTSPIPGDVYPAGIPVASVVSFKTGVTSSQESVVLKPLADLAHLRYVSVVLWGPSS